MQYHKKKEDDNSIDLYSKFDDLFEDIDIEKLNSITVSHWKDEIK